MTGGKLFKRSLCPKVLFHPFHYIIGRLFPCTFSQECLPFLCFYLSLPLLYLHFPFLLKYVFTRERQENGFLENFNIFVSSFLMFCFPSSLPCPSACRLWYGSSYEEGMDKAQDIKIINRQNIRYNIPNNILLVCCTGLWSQTSRDLWT